MPTIVGRIEDLDLLLRGLAAARYPGDAEIILVDNRRTVPEDDALPALVAGCGDPRVRVVRQPLPGISAARNAGVEAAVGEIVAFTDDDVRVDENWLRALGGRFAAQPELDAVTGLILPAELETPAQNWFEQHYGGFSGERTFFPVTLRPARSALRVLRGSRVEVVAADGTVTRRFALYGVGAFGAGASMAFRRARLIEMGGFDLALGTGTAARGGEDLQVLAWTLWHDGRIGYEPSAVVHHRHRRGEDELLRQMQGNGTGFTAMLTSIVRSDPRHAVSIGAQVPLAAGRMLSQTVSRLRGIGPSGAAPHVGAAAAVPREFVLAEITYFDLAACLRIDEAVRRSGIG